MKAILPPTPAEFAGYMTEAAKCLPADWDTAGAWEIHAGQLARFMCDQAGRFPAHWALVLIDLGGMLTKMAERERQATSAAACLIDRATKGRRA